jgi:hypothetical protein
VGRFTAFIMSGRMTAVCGDASLYSSKLFTTRKTLGSEQAEWSGSVFLLAYPARMCRNPLG